MRNGKIILHIYVALLMVSLYFIRFYGMPSYIDDVFYYFLLIILLWNVLVKKRFLSKGFLFLLAAFGLVVLLSFAFSSSYGIDIYYVFRDYFVLFAIVPIVTSLIDEESVDDFIGEFKMIWWLILLIASVIGFLVPNLNLAITYVSDDGPNSLRLGSLLVNPNTFGYVLCIIYSLILDDLVRRFNIIYLIMFISVIVMLVLSGSRSALGIMVLITVMQYGLQKKKAVFVLTGIFVVFALYFTYASLVENGLLAGLDYVDRFSGEKMFYDKNREELWGGLWKYHFDKMTVLEKLFGGGASSVSRLSDDMGYNVLDSYYLKLILEIGVIGLLFYVCLLMWFFFGAIMWVNSNQSIEIRYTLVYPSIIMIVIVAGTTATILDVYPFNYLFLIFISLYFVIRRAESCDTCRVKL